MMHFGYSLGFLATNTSQNFVKGLQIPPVGTSTAVPEFLKPIVKPGGIIILESPVWRRCLPDVRKVLDPKRL
jgi:hypothetical protein